MEYQLRRENPKNIKVKKTVSWADKAAERNTSAPGDVGLGSDRSSPRVTKKPTYKDRRVLLRIKADSETLKKDGYQVRDMLLKHLKLNDRDIENVKPTNTSWVVRV
ncbi:hypothetical protein VHEMI10744 [[Torrubiella] hemipterigena]|uniref:Uncharacterized protein n=1 Tax=[Torrubiella] hemipterigena TaxID=1531966 RepID=A0A0A1TSR6_9HYPO|nr:hypothetical protein VHEMI10744 [[Torrubiella] hemipterigena]